MAKLTVKNVGPIREAELEVKKHTIFIGPQGSGKSTLAKLIAIGGDSKLSEANGQNFNTLITKYSLDSYVSKATSFAIYRPTYNLLYNGDIEFSLSNKGEEVIDSYKAIFHKGNAVYNEIISLSEFRKAVATNDPNVYFGNIQAHSFNFYQQILPIILQSYSLLIPTERHVFPILADSIWSLIDANINLPQSIKGFGREFERARTKENLFQIPFLNILYKYENGHDRVYYSNQESIELSQSASGYQSIIPLLLVVEHQRKQSNRRFIIEEPELNLYPNTQKDLIYSLMGGLQPDVEYEDAEWVITTHSPYVLSSFNILMLAYTVAQQSEGLRAKVEELIPARCWINPDEFAAYYVDEGTVRSIINTTTGLIDENELDGVSDTLADEQEALFDLYRTARQSRA